MLTLEQLCGYLPYKLMIYSDYEVADGALNKCYLDGLSALDGAQSKHVCYGIDNCEVSSIKPFLRSIDKLTHEITVDGYNDGKPFVPIEKLGQLLLDKDGDLGDSLTDAVTWIKMQINGFGVENLHWFLVQEIFKMHFAININKEDYIEIE